MDTKLLVDIAQVATALVTLCALFALLHQVRLLKNQLLTTNQLTVMKDERDIWTMATTSTEAREGLVREIFGPDDPENSPTENLVVSMMFDHYEKIYFQHKCGAFPREIWPSWELHIANTVARPKIFACWENSKATFWDEFVAYFDPKIRSIRSSVRSPSVQQASARSSSDTRHPNVR